MLFRMMSLCFVVLGLVLLAASFGDADANQRQFVALGIDIAQGKNRWDVK